MSRNSSGGFPAQPASARLCAMDAPAGLIEMISGLAVIDRSRIELENEDAIARCPTGAIVWVEGAQFRVPIAAGSA